MTHVFTESINQKSLYSVEFAILAAPVGGRSIPDCVVSYFSRERGCEVLWWTSLRVCPSVHEDISRTTRTIFTSSGGVTIFQGEGRGNVGFSPIDNALYSIAFGTHKTVKRLDRSRCRLGWWLMSGLCPKNNVLRTGDDPLRGRGNFGQNMFPTYDLPL